ncbi:helix-turn-helix domain-containing protein, partial [Pseudacidovorax intermedius]|uniref:helix-turn-helix domain-containing protein n=2 Tax=Pseudacidovorax TaxID=433923 RepID=UPI0005BCF250
MDRLKAMQVFVRIAEQGSLTRAADVLGSSLPAVVRTLAALEAHLGVRLFQRSTRRIALTEDGR